jgi:succinate dehydrogenase hydrophobic anchor subunit
MASGYEEASTQSKQRVTTIVLAVLAIVFLFLRLLARRVKKIHLGPDDTTLIVGLVSLLFFVLKVSGDRV